MKTCSSCKVEKPNTEFFKQKTSRDKLKSWCKLCSKKHLEGWRKANPKKMKGYKRKWYVENQLFGQKGKLKKYGMTVAQYEAMLLTQGSGCAICGGCNKSGYRLAVDHSHSTGKVRGLLCSDCNLSLGKFKDSPALLRKAAEYLETNDMKDSNEKIPIKTEPGTGGQNDAWPGESPEAPKPGTVTEDGAETIIIPIVR